MASPRVVAKFRSRCEANPVLQPLSARPCEADPAVLETPSPLARRKQSVSAEAFLIPEAQTQAFRGQRSRLTERAAEVVYIICDSCRDTCERQLKTAKN